MNTFKCKDIKPFIGSKDYEESRRFYSELGFEVLDGSKYCEVKINDDIGFWLQKYYNESWVNNSMIYLEVDDVEKCEKELKAKGLHEKYTFVRFTGIKEFDWGRELFMHDPSGVLWHFCELNK